MTQPCTRQKWRRPARLLLGAALALPVSAHAQAPTGDLEETIVVTATRVAQSSFDLPISIDSISLDNIQNQQLQINISESLMRVPGLVVQNRQNYAQDLQISSRGFGARSTFGVRGIRIYIDGIPGTQPDGQGQVSNIDLGSAQRIEVLRGPFSALYGNSSGGIISVFSEDGKPGLGLTGTAEYGSFATQRFAAKASGEQDGINYIVNAARFSTDGYRDHSAAKRDNFNSKIRFTLDDASQLTVTANGVRVSAQDALGLTRAQYDANPVQAGTNSVAFNVRKAVDQEQVGLNYTREFGDSDTLSALAYASNRDTLQFQAIPIATQTPASSPGGIIDLNSQYWGMDLHWTDKRDIAGMAFQVAAGLAYDRLEATRKGFQNFIGTRLGIQGALRRNEIQVARDFDQYIQAQLEPGERWLIEAGLRHTEVRLTSADRYIVPGNGDDSGGVTYDAVLPVAGVTFRATEELNLYASYGKGLQTPALDELSYRSTDGSRTGLNFGLRPSNSDNYEIGAKLALDRRVKLNVGAFHIDTTDELAIQANTAGRSVYQNVGQTSRDGIEIGLDTRWDHGIGAQLAYTYLRATYATPFTSCPGLPCVPTTIPTGNRLPGVPLNSIYAELSWRDAESGFSAAIEGRVQGRVFVNDLNNDAAPSYVIANLRAGFEQSWNGWGLKEFIRIENLTDRKYAGSIIVNESNGRFFEPAPGRAVYAGLTASFGG